MIPHNPSLVPVRNNALTTTTSIVVDLPTVTADGGSPILEYSLEYDDGSGMIPFVGTTILDQQLAVPASSGQTFSFRYRVRNIYGWSASYSSETPTVNIRAATVPDPPTGVTTSHNLNQVVVSWTAPAFTGGAGVLITGYMVTIRKSDLTTYSQDISSCDMSASSLLTCNIPMANLLTTPFNL